MNQKVSTSQSNFSTNPKKSKNSSKSTEFSPTHLLQSEAWKNYEKLEGHEAIRLTGKNYTLTAVLHETPFANYLFVPYGPSAANKTALLSALKALKHFAKSKNITFIRIEPTLPLSTSEMTKIAQKLNLKIQKSHDLDPAHTWHLDLTAEKDALLKNMESRKVRYWRNHEKKGMKIRTTKDPDQITILTNLLKNLGEVDNFTPQDETHLKNQLKSGFATLYIIDLATDPPKSSKKASAQGDPEPSFEGDAEVTTEHERRSPVTTAPWDAEGRRPTGRADAPRERTVQGLPIAAALIYDFGDTRYYAHAATDFAHRNLAAGSILLIQMILDAKDNGQKIYDFWGITTSEDKNHPWYGFTQYKKSFGGHQIDYTGTYDLILNPQKYHLYSLFRKLNRKIRKIHKN